MQLAILVILIENIINSDSDIENLMKLFSFGSILYFLNIVITLTEPQNIGLIEGANLYTRAFIIAALFSYYLSKKSKQYRYLYRILILMQCIGVTLTQSRTGIILLIIGLIIVLYKDYKFSARSLGAVLIIGALVLYVIPETITFSIQSDFVAQNSESRGRIDYGTIDNNIRLYLWTTGYELWTESNIFLGIGIGKYKELISSYLPFVSTGIGVHNTYLSILYETGIFGFIIFIWIIIRSFAAYFNAAFSEKTVGIATVWLLSFSLLLIGGMTKHEHYEKTLFIFIGISYYFQSRKLISFEKGSDFISN
ncbi:MAG: O-antigen ligase family protein [Cyclobacteriaceae bacterium]